ncbi:acyl-CoA dehydrogenase family protein [Mesobacillus foraminis]|uniref:acyl-CoA dehydrogenase family protein n=1 Tax=Mesobacillus foraminis TaxID=279826 RepID=UPI0039A1130F
MYSMNTLNESRLKLLMEDHLIPYVKKIDTEAYYPKAYLKKLGEAGFLTSVNKDQKDYVHQEMDLIEATARTCMTAAFCLWCHLAFVTFLRHTKNQQLKHDMLPLVENGEVLGGTGLSNGMKYYAGLEKLFLSAKPAQGGYIISGVLPSVSNLGEDHWFGFIAGIDEDRQIMAIVPCNASGLKLKEKVGYLGVNGSATYTCSFNEVFIPHDWIISENAKGFVGEIRSTFLAYQIPLGIGVIEASIASIEKVCNRQNKCNQFLNQQPEDLVEKQMQSREKLRALFMGKDLNWKDVVELRLETAYLALEAVQSGMLHNGSAGYFKDSAPSRRLREAYFFANLTPTVKHLEKMLKG